MDSPPVAIGLDAPHTNPERVEEFLSLVARHQRRLSVFVGSLVPHPPDAEDVLQETNLVLWREFHHFEPGTNFAAWACTVALNQVLAWRKRRQRDRLVFSEAFLAAVSQELLDEDEAADDRSHALAGCVERMPPHHRQVLALRYTEGQSVESIAARLSRTTEAVYRMLSRIRAALFDCTSRQLVARGTPP
jgi:RNA polymerase sigma-70 factor (ECF subfamily)